MATKTDSECAHTTIVIKFPNERIKSGLDINFKETGYLEEISVDYLKMDFKLGSWILPLFGMNASKSTLYTME